MGGVGISYIASTEEYDPATNSWHVTGYQLAQRIFHTATLLPNGQVLTAGSLNSLNQSTAELYTPLSP